jgi:hypothetical protein
VDGLFAYGAWNLQNMKDETAHYIKLVVLGAMIIGEVYILVTLYDFKNKKRHGKNKDNPRDPKQPL